MISLYLTYYREASYHTNMENISKNLPQESERETILARLKSHGIDTSTWGTGSAKTVDHLLKEVSDGEVELVERNGQLYRELTLVNVDVVYTDEDNQQLHLVEDKQVFNDGRVRNRKGIVGASLSEKIKSEENRPEAAIRALKEELGIEIGDNEMSSYDTIDDTFESPSYPGLQTHYQGEKFRIVLHSDQFKSGGYVEVQKDKNTYFVWEKVA